MTFDIDADGVVNVSAKDLGTGRSQAIRVTAASGLGEAEVARLVEEAEANRQADLGRRELVELRNKADGLIYSTVRTLEEFKQNVRAEDRNALEKSIAATRKVLEGADAAALRAAVDELSGLTYKMTETLYAELGGEESE